MCESTQHLFSSNRLSPQIYQPLLRPDVHLHLPSLLSASDLHTSAPPHAFIPLTPVTHQLSPSSASKRDSVVFTLSTFASIHGCQSLYLNPPAIGHIHIHLRLSLQTFELPPGLILNINRGHSSTLSRSIPILIQWDIYSRTLV